ncbi:Abi family protein, partial [Mycobacteroides abscessus]
MVETPQQAEVRRAAALDRAISTPRYASYLNAAGQDADRARKLYVWDRDLSTAILADLAIVEVALRNALHNALTGTYGPEWYQNIALDDRSMKQVERAWGYLRNPRQGHPSTPGRVIAQCTFGMWVNLLDAGGYAGREPRRVHADYEQLWRSTLRSAFPGGRI